MEQKNLFSDDQLDNLNPKETSEEGPVTVFGLTFKNQDERRQYFRDELRKILPELKKMEGYPIGEDDDIINLSDPPYYTACPNPWLNDFIKQWEKDKIELQRNGKRIPNFEQKTPYANGITQTKNSVIYNAHSYHTKVPHEVIMRYLLHYTQPGDIIMDNFCGTGMTGVACNEINKKSQYNNIFSSFENAVPGYRKCIQGDLSPIASFIAYNYTNQFDLKDFIKVSSEIFNQLKDDYEWMYTTKDGTSYGKVNYYVWSESQICPSCRNEFIYWDSAVDLKNNIVKNEYCCPHCGCRILKKDSLKATETYFDKEISSTYERVKYVPVMVNYTINGRRKERPVNDYDLEILNKIYSLEMPHWVPVDKMMGKGEHWGDTWRAGYHVGFNYVHNFYTRRNLIILSKFNYLIDTYDCDNRLKSFLKIWFTSSLSRLHIMNRYAANHHRHVGPLANTLYISGTPAEISPFYFINSKIKDNSIVLNSSNNVVNQIASATKLNIADNSIDYIFTDPPFGGNIMYSELNFISESWIKVITNNQDEAITNNTQNKGTSQYQDLMFECFKEYYRVLKPNKWMTVEFSNTSAAIWNAIQYAIQKAGFIITNVADLSKGRGGLHGIYSVVAVNQDLAISCYKPDPSNCIKCGPNRNVDPWSFIEDFLNHTPIHVTSNNSTTAVVERSPKILFDRLVSYFVQNNQPIPMDASSFQKGLRQRFVERDGMFFTATQVIEYEEKKIKAPNFVPMGIIVSDEANGIEWLKNKLREKSQTYSDLQPEWMKALNGIRKGDQVPGLDVLLEENFIQNEDKTWRIANVNDNVDLEQLRTKALLKEFKLYLEICNKPHGKLKDVRVEAVRAGFKQCYADKNFADIILVGDRIPQNLLTEDEILLQYYDIASTKI